MTTIFLCYGIWLEFDSVTRNFDTSRKSEGDLKKLFCSNVDEKKQFCREDGEFKKDGGILGE